MPKNATPYALEQSHASGVTHGQASHIMYFHPILKNGAGEMITSYLPYAMIVTVAVGESTALGVSMLGDLNWTVPRGHGSNGN
jgi:hypothetical protein